MALSYVSDAITRVKEGPLSLKESAYVFRLAAEDERYRERVREAIGTTDFDSFLTHNIEAKIKLGVRETPSVGDSIARIEHSNKTEETILSTDELSGTFGEVQEGSDYPTAGFGKSETKIKTAKYGEIIEVTEEMIYFDRTGELNRSIEKLSRKAARTKDELILRALIDGENLANATAGIYTSARGNRGTAALSESALVDRITAFRLRKDTSGKAIDIAPNLLVVTPQNEVTARKLLNSIEVRSSDGGAANGTKNVIPDMLDGSASLVVSARLSEMIARYNDAYANDTWFLIRAQEGIVYYEVWPIQVFSQQPDAHVDGGFTRDVYRYKVRFFGGAGVHDPLMLDGSFVS